MENPSLRGDRYCFLLMTVSLALFAMLMLVQRADAIEFKVGGANGWTLPTQPNAFTLNQWAEMYRFRIGDSLLFVYEADKDSVLQVKKEDYNNCNIEAPIASFSNGHTSFIFNQSGPYYFISGTDGNCLKNEKMVVVVMAARGNNTSTSPPPPSDGTPEPSVAPVGEESPSPPSPSKNGASSMAMGFVGSVALILGSSFLVAF